MNEQLKEFAYESGLLSKRVFDDSWVDNPKLEAKLKKFAELVVRECMMVCQNTSVREDDGQTFVYSDAIQEHFRS